MRQRRKKKNLAKKLFFFFFFSKISTLLTFEKDDDSGGPEGSHPGPSPSPPSTPGVHNKNNVSINVYSSAVVASAPDPDEFPQSREAWEGPVAPAHRPALLSLLLVKKILLAVALLVGGVLILTIGALIYSGKWPDARDSAPGLVVIGCLMVLPGGYMTRIAYKAWRGEAGFTFNQIPEL